MMTIEQCRGARGLLGWTQQDLADASGLSKTAINNFEKGHSDIKSESLRAIRMAFESADIEFLGQEGIRRCKDNIRILKGARALADLLDDMRETLKVTGGDVMISHVDGTLPAQISAQDFFKHSEFLQAQGIRQRVLCARGDKNIISAQDEYRWLSPEACQSGMATFIYGSKVVFALWESAVVVIVGSAEAQRAERARFEHLWGRAEIPQTEGSLPGAHSSAK